MSQYEVKTLDHPIDAVVEVPGSKSITNRALFMAAMSKSGCELNGLAFSDDSRYFLNCLISLGFVIEVNEVDKYARIEGYGGQIPKISATINVGSAGTGARFLTALLAASDGEYVIEASEQMKKRPMKALFDALIELGAEFDFLEKEGHLPVRVRGAYHGGRTANAEVHIDISESTQFLSALMMIAPVLKEGLTIKITSKKTNGSYIEITKHMMAQFGCHVEHDGNIIRIGKQDKYVADSYQIEPDVSGACYFYAAAALLGGSVTVLNVHSNSMQGDYRFIDLLSKMGCSYVEKAEGICLTGPKDGILHGIDIDMNDFSDQSMTLAAIAPFADSDTYIRNIGHIRLQESDRIKAIVTELRKLGINVEEEEDAIKIHHGLPHAATVDTYDDHRMAMAFALIGLKVDGIVIDNYMCCRKTFENYFDVLEGLY